MDDVEDEEISSDYSEYESSFIDDDLFEEELTWDSEDSRPPGPSPPSQPPMRMQASVYGARRRLGSGRRQHQIEINISFGGNSSQNSLSVNTSMDQEDSNSLSDSDQTNLSSQPHSPTDSSGPHQASQELEDDGDPDFEGFPSDIDVNDDDDDDDDDVILIEPDENVAADPAEVAADPAEVAVEPAPEPHIVEAANNDATAPSSSPTTNLNSAAAVSAKLDSSVLSEGDDNSLCSICMDPLTNSGKHRVVCLRCGHIFGQSCVERWIKVGCNNGARRCPTCNKKANLKDIRVLYLPKVVPLDTSERDRLLQEKEELAAQKKVIESELSRTILRHKLVVEKYEERLKTLEKRLEGAACIDLTPSQPGVVMLASVDISSDGGCRVMAFNHHRQQLVISQPSGSTIFAGFGVRVLNSVDWRPASYVLLHSKMVRDLTFHAEDRDLLLSVSLDQTAKLVDLASSSTVHIFRGEGPLWSCSWDASHPHLLLLGSQMGKVCQYDRRMLDHNVNSWETENNKTPVVALASAHAKVNTPFPQGGFLSCRLNAVFAYPRQGEKYTYQELPLEGPFMSMKYDLGTQTLLTGARPSSHNPHAHVCVNLLDTDTQGKVCAPLIHEFSCGSSARVLSRPTMLPYFDDALVAAHNESGRTIELWSTKSGARLHSIPVREPIIDLAPLPMCNNKTPLLAALSEKKVSIFKIE